MRAMLCGERVCESGELGGDASREREFIWKKTCQFETRLTAKKSLGSPERPVLLCSALCLSEEMVPKRCVLGEALPVGEGKVARCWTLAVSG